MAISVCRQRCRSTTDIPYTVISFLKRRIFSILICFIRFTGSVKLKSLTIIGGEDGSAPSRVKCFINRDDIDFTNVESFKKAVVQEFELPYDKKGEIDHPTKMTKFSSCTSLTLFFDENHGAQTTKIYWIGLKGDFTPLSKQIVVTAYEL